jgi:uncharacterized membrane protein YhaH (DUF805 family)
MSFADAVRSVLSQYVGLTGRARRSEYWWWALAYLILVVIAVGLDSAIGTSVVAPLVALAVLLPNLAVAVRRLHDTGRSGWWILLGLIPLVGGIILLVFYVSDGNPGPNAYGPDPKQPQSALV